MHKLSKLLNDYASLISKEDPNTFEKNRNLHGKQDALRWSKLPHVSKVLK